MPKIDWFYTTREERSRWIVERFAEIFSAAKSVLDVGCGQDKFLKKFVPSAAKYFGIDAVGEPDQIVNFDQTGKLPFKNGEFDAVVCADVLEHLEEVHSVYDELMRVGRKNVIITLPIPARLTIIKKFFLKQPIKRYGLPLEKPADRHRWFFTYYEAERFLKERAERAGFAVKVFESDADYSWKNMGWSKRTIAKVFGAHLISSLVIVLLERK